MTSNSLALIVGQHLWRPNAKEDLVGFMFNERTAFAVLLITKCDDIFKSADIEINEEGNAHETEVLEYTEKRKSLEIKSNEKDGDYLNIEPSSIPENKRFSSKVAFNIRPSSTKDNNISTNLINLIKNDSVSSNIEKRKSMDKPETQINEIQHESKGN